MAMALAIGPGGAFLSWVGWHFDGELNVLDYDSLVIQRLIAFLSIKATPGSGACQLAQ
jgi:hypothetical protein